MAEEKKFPLIDLLGMGNLLESLVATDTITCEERDRVILRLAKKHSFPEYTLSTLAGYGRSKNEVLERAARRKASMSQNNELDDSYVSLTQMAQAHSMGSPGCVIQRWLRNENTLAFLNSWEKENNPDYRKGSYIELLEKMASFTLTPKLWIERTKAIGIVSRQGKSGGTFAHPIIAGEFASWIAPEFKMLLLKLSLNRQQLM